MSIVLQWLSLFILVVFIVFYKPVCILLKQTASNPIEKFTRFMVISLVFNFIITPAIYLYIGDKNDFFTFIYYFLVIIFIYLTASFFAEQRGVDNFKELLGISSTDNILEIQERLMESKMRFPDKKLVIISIADLAKKSRENKVEKV